MSNQAKNTWQYLSAVLMLMLALSGCGGGGGSTTGSTSTSVTAASILGTWKIMTEAPNGGAPIDVSSAGITVTIDAAAATFTVPANATVNGTTIAACTETDSWSLNGNKFTTTVTATSGTTGQVCDPVGTSNTVTLSLSGNTMTVTTSTGTVRTLSFQSAGTGGTGGSTGTTLATSMLGTWTWMTHKPSGGTLTDYSANGFTVRFDTSVATITLSPTYTEIDSWTLTGNILTTTVASCVPASSCVPGKRDTATVAVSGGTMTITWSSGTVDTFSLQSGTGTGGTGGTVGGTGSTGTQVTATSLLGLWKMMTVTQSGSTTPTDVSAAGATAQIDASVITYSLPGTFTETDSWTLNGNRMTTTVISCSPASSCAVGTVSTVTVSVSGVTMTVTSPSGAVQTYSR